MPSTRASSKSSRATGTPPTRWATSTFAPVRPTKRSRNTRAIAEHLVHEGFYSRAAALYKKILKIKPDDEAAQLQLGELSAKQGLLADAKSYFSVVGDRRRARGDQAGADEMVVRLGSVDPSDVEGRSGGGRVLEESGETLARPCASANSTPDLTQKGNAGRGARAPCGTRSV